MTRFILIMAILIRLHAAELIENRKFTETNISPQFKNWEIGLGDLHNDMHENYPVYVGTFTFPTKVHAHPTISCDFVIPLRPNGLPLPTAGDMIALFPWPGRQWLRSDESAWDWARRYGFTVFTLNFINHDQAKPEDEENYYIYPKSGSAIAWSQAHLNLLEILSLPIQTRLFAWGESAGGSAAQLYASAFPVRVDGLVAFSGRTFDVANPFLGPTLLLHTSEDRMEENIGLADIMEKAGSSPLHFAYPPNWLNWKPGYGWAHTVSTRAKNFAQCWIRSLAIMRLKSGKIPPSSEWEVVDTQRLPNKQLCAEAWQDLIANPQVTTPQGGGMSVVTMTPPAGPSNGTIVWIDHRFGIGGDALSIVARILSDSGYACAAISGSDPARTYAEITRDTRRLPAPRTLIVIAPPAGDMPWSKSSFFKSVTIVDPSHEIAKEVLASLNAVTALGTVCSPDSPSGPLGKVQWKTMIKTDNSHMWLIELMKTILPRRE